MESLKTPILYNKLSQSVSSKQQHSAAKPLSVSLSNSKCDYHITGWLHGYRVFLPMKSTLWPSMAAANGKTANCIFSAMKSPIFLFVSWIDGFKDLKEKHLKTSFHQLVTDELIPWLQLTLAATAKTAHQWCLLRLYACAPNLCHKRFMLTLEPCVYLLDRICPWRPGNCRVVCQSAVKTRLR